MPFQRCKPRYPKREKLYKMNRISISVSHSANWQKKSKIANAKFYKSVLDFVNHFRFKLS